MREARMDSFVGLTRIKLGTDQVGEKLRHARIREHKILI